MVSVTGIRGWIEKDFDDKHLITVFWCCVHSDELWFINHCCFPFKIIISNNKKVEKKKSRQRCADHFWATLQSPSSCDCPHNLTVRVYEDVSFFPSLVPQVYASLVTTSQLRMKYGTNYPIMSEKGSELAGAWLKSNLTLISPKPLGR